MDVQALYRYARISPLKARDVARQIQGLPVSQAISLLDFTPRKAAVLIGKTLKSAVANAENNHELAPEDLLVKEARVDKGPMFRRMMPRARGSGAPIRRRTSHILIVLTDEAPAAVERSARGGRRPARAAASEPAEPDQE